jgi:hypothetical protein
MATMEGKFDFRRPSPEEVQDGVLVRFGSWRLRQVFVNLQEAMMRTTYQRPSSALAIAETDAEDGL